MLFYSKVRVCEVCLFDYSILIKKIVKDSMLKIGSQPTNTFCISVFCMPTVFFHQLNPAKITFYGSKSAYRSGYVYFFFSTTLVLFLVQRTEDSA